MERFVLTQEQVERFNELTRTRGLIQLKSRLRDIMDGIANTTRTLNNQLKSKAEVEEEIKVQEQIKTIDVQQRLDELMKLKKLESYSLNEATITLNTVPLICRASNGGLYAVGRYKITINTTDGEIRFYNLDDKNIRRSYWGSRCHHPHVSEDNTACLGNSTEPLAVLNNQKEYQAMAQICIAFLEQANLEDVAGRHVANWDKVDEQGNIIHPGSVYTHEEDFEYDFDDHEDDNIDTNVKCMYDDNWYDRDECIYIEEEGRWIHESNYSKMFVNCEDCNANVRKNRAIEINGKKICKNCAETYTKCDGCGKWEKQITEKELDGVTLKLCNKCLEEIVTCNDCGKEILPLQKVTIKYSSTCVCKDCSKQEKYVRDENFDLILREDAIQCENCGDFVHKSQIFKENLCATCYDALNNNSKNATSVETLNEQDQEEPYFNTPEEAEEYYAKKREEKKESEE